jgi:hypothetical protein
MASTVFAPVHAAPAAAQGEAAALVAGTRWAAEDGGAVVVGYNFVPGAQCFGATEQATVRSALASIEAVCGIRFVQTADPTEATLHYGYSCSMPVQGAAGYAYYPADNDLGGDVLLADKVAGAEWDGYRPYLLLHETLHALGLKHPFEGSATLPRDLDSMVNTVMSYTAVAGLERGGLTAYPSEPMRIDVEALQALQALYGASSANSGDTVYDLSAARFQGGLCTLWDAGGHDRLDASACQAPVSIDLRAGASSDVGACVTGMGRRPDSYYDSVAYTDTLTIAKGCTIEDATGSAFDDVLVGNAAANVLVGGAGDDQLSGLDGDDVLDGGPGNDVLVGGAGVDTAVFHGPLAAFAVRMEGNGYTVLDLRSGERDMVTGVELLRFDDTVVDLTAPVPVPPPQTPAAAPQGAAAPVPRIDLIGQYWGEIPLEMA